MNDLSYPDGHPLKGRSEVEILDFTYNPNAYDDIEKHSGLWSIRVDWLRAGNDGKILGYQRPGRPDDVAKYIQAHFHKELLGTPLVSRRSDGSLWFLDGQGRGLALRSAFPAGTTLRAEVFEGLTLSEESWIFQQINDMSQKVSAEASFAAAANQDAAWQKEVDEVLKSYKYFVGPKQACPDGWIVFQASSTINRYHKEAAKSGYDYALIVKAACSFMNQVFPSTKPSSVIFGASLKLFILNYLYCNDVKSIVARFASTGYTEVDVFTAAGAVLGKNGKVGRRGADDEKMTVVFGQIMNRQPIFSTPRSVNGAFQAQINT